MIGSMDLRSDPDAPLDDAPDPWAGTSMPSLRAGPPYHMTEMIAAEPGLARRLLGRLRTPEGAAARIATAVSQAIAARTPVILTGCGTSEHAAIGGVAILRDALAVAGVGAERALVSDGQAFELGLDPPRAGLVIGISHEGGTAATNRALEAARSAGARVAMITASDRSPGAALADQDLLVATGEMDESWCHTVGYLSPLLVMASIAGRISRTDPDPEVVAELVAAGATLSTAAESAATTLRDVDRMIVIASGADRAAGRELVIKLEEGPWMPSAYRDLETFLHGHLPATDEKTGLVLILLDRADREDRVARAVQALRAAAAVGVRSTAIASNGVSGQVPEELTPAGRLVVPDEPRLSPPVAALIGSAAPLQLLTERLARARGANPDSIRREDPRYLAGSQAAE
jgi:glucosamine--fructose-6-phosphate aminotransferase (isomerizing)